MTAQTGVLLLALLSRPPWLGAEEISTPTLTFQNAVREALSRSPEVEAAHKESILAALEEPILLSNLDPRFQSSYFVADDQAPRAAPAFQGLRAQLEHWEAGFVQNTLLGTEARLRWTNERLKNQATFRVLDPSVDSRLSLDLRQPLLRYFWGRPDLARRQRARAGEDGARARLRQVQENAVLKAARAYLELHFAQEQIRIKTEGVKDAKILLAKNEEKRRYGLAEESDLLQARSSVELQETAVLIAESQRERAQNALWAAMHRESLPFRVETSSSEILPRDDDLEASDVKSLSSRPDVQSARKRREALEWNLRVGKLDTLPDLSLSLSYGAAGLAGDYGGSWQDLGSFSHSLKSAGLSLTLPFASTRERLARRQNLLQLEVAAAQAREAESRGLREIRDGRENLRLARLRVEAGRRLLELERRKFRAEEENFRRGRSSTDLLIRFQQDIRRAQANLLEAEMDEAVARLELRRCLGVLLEAFPQ
ncbi:MAG: TolC family protein [Elusimicrobia bacterium]|nr:TolC family protein [Elusimicrobiota bacterium]